MPKTNTIHKRKKERFPGYLRFFRGMQQRRQKPRFHLEALEPKILLSATPLPEDWGRADLEATRTELLGGMDALVDLLMRLGILPYWRVSCLGWVWVKMQRA